MKPGIPSCILALAAVAGAQDLKMPRGRIFNGDLASTRLLLDWDKSEYTLRHGKGVKKVTCAVSGTIRKRRYDKPVEAKAVFTWSRWDAKLQSAKADLKWKSNFLGSLFSQEGWSAEALAEFYDPSYWRKLFKKCTLSATRETRRTVVTVKGDNRKRIRKLVFDANGVLIERVIGGAAGLPIDDKHFGAKSTYRKEERTWLLVKRRHNWSAPGIGTLETITEYAYEKVGGLLVPARITQTQLRNQIPTGDTLELVFGDYKIERTKK